jgi:small GTP-binding protein
MSQSKSLKIEPSVAIAMEVLTDREREAVNRALQSPEAFNELASDKAKIAVLSGPAGAKALQVTPGLRLVFDEVSGNVRIRDLVKAEDIDRFMPVAWDVFLSHSSKDISPARELAGKLRRSGLRVWWNESIKPGQDWNEQIREALASSRTIVFFMSKNAFASEWVNLEWQTSLFRDPANQKRRFVPLLLEDTPIPEPLARYRYIDWRDRSSESYANLLTACKRDVLRYQSAKIVILGDSGVGKTGLALRLSEARWAPSPSTHGIVVSSWRMPFDPTTNDVSREVWLWDLGGQENYRLIHQLYLDEVALGMIVFDPTRENSLDSVCYWKKTLEDSTRDRRSVALLLVAAKCDRGEVTKRSEFKSYAKQNGFLGMFFTSAKTGYGVTELAAAISSNIDWAALPTTSTSRLLGELKAAIIAMNEQEGPKLLRFSELVQRLEQALPMEKFGKSDVRTAVALLGNRGLIMPLKFGDLVLLHPEVLDGYASAIIRAAGAHPDEIGCVLEADINKPDFDFTGVERLRDRSDEELLLRALVQTFLDHSLCIAEDTAQGRQLVFPSQYRRGRNIPRDPPSFVSYTFGGEWQTVWTTLVVRLWYSQEFEHRALWRNAAEFASSKGHVLGLKIDNTEGEGEATISLYFDKEVPDELKAIFVEYVHRHLAKYGREVSRNRRYMCPACGEPIRDLDAVRKRLEAKKDFIHCQWCDEKVPLIDFIEQRLDSDPVARRILAMDDTTSRQLETQALEQILTGHIMAVASEANQMFRPTTMSAHGIDGEVEFKDNDGKASGKRIYIQLKSANYYLRISRGDGSEVFEVKNNRYSEYWINQPVDVYLVIRQADDASGEEVIRWMNVSRYLKARKDQKSRQIIFDGEKLDMAAIWKVRDSFFPPEGSTTRKN